MLKCWRAVLPRAIRDHRRGAGYPRSIFRGAWRVAKRRRGHGIRRCRYGWKVDVVRRRPGYQVREGITLPVVDVHHTARKRFAMDLVGMFLTLAPYWTPTYST